MASLGIVSYDAACVAKERLRQGSDFYWGVEGEIKVIDGNAVVKEKEEHSHEHADETEVEEEKKDMPVWLKIAFLASFGFNLLAIITIFICCKCRKKGNKREFYQFDQLQSSTTKAGTGRVANNSV